MFSYLMNTANGSIDILKNNRDKILLVGGIAAGIGTVITASRATLKAKDIVEEHKTNKRFIDEAIELDPGYNCSTTHKRDKLINNIGTVANIAKVYAPSVVLGATSIACLVGEHCVMQTKINNLEKSVASLSAAYIAVDTAFKAYRKRVVAKYGEEEDRRLRYDITEETKEYTDEKGKKKKEKYEKINDLSPNDTSKFFDATCASFLFQDPMKYKPDWDANLEFLQGIENWANQVLSVNGYLFLNDVYEALGIPITDAGQVNGWVLDEDDPDNLKKKISFGIYKPTNHMILNGGDDDLGILLEFNIDGVIIGKTKLAAK